MTLGHKTAVLGCALLTIVLAFFANDWHNKGVGLAALDATLKTQKTFQAQLDSEKEAAAKQQADLASQSALVVRDLQERLAALEQQKAAVVTPEQVAGAIRSYLPSGLPAPVTTVTTPAPAGAPPGTPPTVTGLLIPAADMKPEFNQLVDCRECGAKLTAAFGQVSILQDEVKSLQEQMGILQQQITSLTKERDVAIKAAKGGSVWSRVKHDGKMVAGGIIVGVLLAAMRK